METTYTFEINGKQVGAAEVLNANAKGEHFTVTEWVNGKYNGHWCDYIPHRAIWR